MQSIEQPAGFSAIGEKRPMDFRSFAAAQGKSKIPPGFPRVIFGEQTTRVIATKMAQRKNPSGVFFPPLSEQAHGAKRVAKNLPNGRASTKMRRQGDGRFLPLSNPGK